MPKMHQNTFGARLCPDPLPRSLSRNKGGPTSKGRRKMEGKERKGRGRGRKGRYVAP